MATGKGNGVRASARLYKLLETATHPTVTPGERINALEAFRRIADKAGGIEAALDACHEEKTVRQLQEVQIALNESYHRILLLERESDIAHNEIIKLREKYTRPTVVASSIATANDKRLIRDALCKDWQELHQIHELAKQAGFDHPSATTLKCLESLIEAGVAATRNPGNHRDRFGTERWQPRAWRLKRSSFT